MGIVTTNADNNPKGNVKGLFIKETDSYRIGDLSMKLEKSMKFADDYPLAVLALGTVGIMYAFENVGQMNGLGQATFKTSGSDMDTLFHKTGHTGSSSTRNRKMGHSNAFSIRSTSSL